MSIITHKGGYIYSLPSSQFTETFKMSARAFSSISVTGRFWPSSSDSASRAGGGLLSLQTGDMVTEHGNELYHSNHLLPGNNVMVNQYTIHLRRAKPNTCDSKPIFRMGLAI